MYARIFRINIKALIRYGRRSYFPSNRPSKQARSETRKPQCPYLIIAATMAALTTKITAAMNRSNIMFPRSLVHKHVRTPFLRNRR
jgi:hypothetical protein